MSEPVDVYEIGHTDATGDLSTPAEDLQAELDPEPYPDVKASSPDHPSIAFVQAAGYTVGRPDGKPLWIVVHDMEASETSQTAENTAAYFANPPDGRNVSSHYTVDNNSVVQCVRLKDCAWTVGNRPGNNRGINWELAGFASQSRAQWLDAFGLAMFNQIKPILRSDAAKFGIPIQRRTVAELKAWKPGITSHNDLRLAFGGTTHTDPGANFPWDVFLQTMQEDDFDVDKETFMAWWSDAAHQMQIGRSGKTFASTFQWSDFETPSKYPSSDGAVRTQDQKIQDLEEIIRFGRAYPSWLVTVINQIKAEQVTTNERLTAIEAMLGQAPAPPPGQVVVAQSSVADIAHQTVAEFGRELSS